MRLEDTLASFDLSRLDCFYADLRLEEEEGTLIGFKNGRLENFSPISSRGAFLRVYNNGKWFYRSVTDLTRIGEGFSELIAQSKSFQGKCDDLFAHVPRSSETMLRFEGREPRLIPLREKRALAESYLVVREGVPEVNEHVVNYRDRYQKRAFRSSRGRSFVYDYVDFGLHMSFGLRDGQHLFRDAFRLWANELPGISGRQAEARAYLEESRRHLRAPAIQPGKYPVVMSPGVVGVFTHESFGHKSEADFMLGDESARNEWKIGTKVAADCVSIVDEGAPAGNSGYCPIDDEGMPKTKTYLIRNGVLQGRLHSLATAHEFGEKPTGNARAINFEFEPIVRMTNTYIEAGTKSEEELLAPISEGVYVTDYSHGSGLSTFTIAPLRAYWIRGGKIAEPVKVPVISGSVFETLNKITGVSRELELESSAFGGCGKDEQFPLRVADGGPMMSVSEMQVG